MRFDLRRRAGIYLGVWAAVAGLGALAGGSAARGDAIIAGPEIGETAAGAPDAPKDAAESASEYLGEVYKDERAGIKFAPPAGSTIENRAMPGELVTFVQRNKQWGGDIRSIVLPVKTGVDEYLRECVAQLNKDFPGMQVLENRDLTFGGRKAGMLTTSMEGDVTPVGAPKGAAKQKLALFRQQLLIQVEDNQFILLTFYTALGDKDAASKTFAAMMQSFEILNKQQLVKRRLAAIQAGKDWLGKRTAEELKSKLINEPQIYRMKLAGKDVGYMRFIEGEQAKSDSAGIMVGVDSRSLDGTYVTFGKNNAYWAYSRDEKNAPRRSYSEWENSTKMLVPRPGTNLTDTFWVTEGGTLSEEGGSPIDAATLEQLKKDREALIRDNDLSASQIPPPIQAPDKQYHMVVTYTGDNQQGFQGVNHGIDVVIPDYRPAIMPKILEYVRPRLVDLKTPSEMTFTAYNSGKRKITLRTLSVVGPDKINLQGKMVDCVKCMDEMDDASTTIWADAATGRILKMLTSTQSLIEPTTEQQMVRMWHGKLTD